MTMKFTPRILLTGLLALLAGCATLDYAPAPEARLKGSYHEVRTGDTLWSISRAYGTSLSDIVKANRIPDASKIQIGQLIFIPGTAEEPNIKKLKTKNYAESFIWPVKGAVISHFGSEKNLARNKGIDIAAKFGADVVASRTGKVVFASEKVKGYGKTIIIDHGSGFQTVYAHNSRILTEAGKDVKQNQVIAKVGASGVAEEPALHFEIRKDSVPQNPFYYLP